MDGPDVGDHADVGLGDRAPARRSGPSPRIAISSTSTSVSGGARQDGERQPDLGVEVPRLAAIAPVRRDQRGDQMSLVEVLPTEPVTPITAAPSSRRQPRASAPSAAQRVVGDDHGAAGARPSASSAHCGSTTTPQRAGVERRGRERAAVDALARQPDEQVAGLAARESIDGRGPAAGRAPPDARARARRRPCAAIRWALQRRSSGAVTPAPQRLARHRRRRRTAPCARPRTPAPARGPCRRSPRRRRAAPSRPRGRSPRGGRLDARARAAAPRGTPATISSTIASGSSERGLSEVMIATSASRAPISPISGRLARSRSPPAPNTTITPPVGQLARRAQHVLQRVRLVRVVDETANGWPSSTGSKRPGTPRRLGQRGAQRRRAGAERPRRRASAPSAFSTLKRPGSGSAHRDSPSGAAQREVASPCASERDVERARSRPRASIANVSVPANSRGQPPPVRVVGVHDPHARVGSSNSRRLARK